MAEASLSGRARAARWRAPVALVGLLGFVAGGCSDPAETHDPSGDAGDGAFADGTDALDAAADVGPEDGADPGPGDAGPTPCTSSLECPDSEVCDVLAGRCVGCRTSADCPYTARCVRGACEATDVCAGASQCDPPLECQNDRQLVAEGGYCDSCFATCDAGRDCVEGTCVLRDLCERDGSCADPDLACTDVGGPFGPVLRCAECDEARDCPEGFACERGSCRDRCRAEGRLCGTAGDSTCGACVTGSCVDSGAACERWQIARDGLFTGNLVVEGDVLYAIAFRLDDEDAELIALDLTDGSTTTRATGLPRSPIAVHDGDAYWFDRDRLEIQRAPLDGGSAPQTLATLEQGLCFPAVVTDRWIFCGFRDFADPDAGGLYRMPVDGGPLTPVWARAGEPLKGLQRVGDRIYWATAPVAGTRSTVGWTPVDGTDRNALFTDVVLRFAATPGAVYYTTFGGREVRRYRLADDRPERFWSGGIGAVAGPHVYLIGDNPEGIYRTTHDLAPPRVIVRGDELRALRPRDLAASDAGLLIAGFTGFTFFADRDAAFAPSP